MRILVTGGAGFLGSWLVDRLVDAHEVLVVDDLSRGQKEWINHKARFHKLDITQPALERVFKRWQPDVIFHCAAQRSILRSVEVPLKTTRVNLLGSLNLLELCRRYKVKGFIYASSAAVYGQPQYLPCDEEHPIRPLSPYGAALASVEHYLNLYHRLYGLKYRLIRSPNIYGPRQEPRDGGVAAIFTNQMLKGDQVVIDGTGEQERDFLFIEDAVEGFISLFNNLEHDSPHQIYNLGQGQGVSINDLFRQLTQLTRYSQPPIHGPVRPGEVYELVLNPHLAQRELNWRPKTPLAVGLKLTVDFFKSRL
jgi:UDP-glucose 4-epimerase